MPPPDRARDYRHFLTISTRWMDNDAYGHINNVTYYSYFDTVVNEHLINAGGLDIAGDPVVGYVVETQCLYRKPLTFPDAVDAGMRVVKLGTSSVTYEIGIFRQGDDDAAATGRFVHVWVIVRRSGLRRFRRGFARRSSRSSSRGALDAGRRRPRSSRARR